jgi:hypothetical protein
VQVSNRPNDFLADVFRPRQSAAAFLSSSEALISGVVAVRGGVGADDALEAGRDAVPGCRTR